MKEEQNPKVLPPDRSALSLLHVPNTVSLHCGAVQSQMEQLKMELSMLEELAAD